MKKLTLAIILAGTAMFGFGQREIVDTNTGSISLQQRLLLYKQLQSLQLQAALAALESDAAKDGPLGNDEAECARHKFGLEDFLLLQLMEEALLKGNHEAMQTLQDLYGTQFPKPTDALPPLDKTSARAGDDTASDGQQSQVETGTSPPSAKPVGSGFRDKLKAAGAPPNTGTISGEQVGKLASDLLSPTGLLALRMSAASEAERLGMGAAPNVARIIVATWGAYQVAEWANDKLMEKWKEKQGGKTEAGGTSGSKKETPATGTGPASGTGSSTGSGSGSGSGTGTGPGSGTSGNDNPDTTKPKQKDPDTGTMPRMDDDLMRLLRRNLVQLEKLQLKTGGLQSGKLSGVGGFGSHGG